MKVFDYKEIESTQLKAKGLCEAHEAPFIVLAESQQKGKATKGRSWHSPSGGFYFTLVMELDFNLLEIDIVKFSQESCLLVVEVLKEILEKEYLDLKNLKVKPINDLYYNEAKLAGVLLESLNKNKNSILLIGIGMNIRKFDSQGIDREVVSLEEILSLGELRKFSNLIFAQKLGSELLERLSALKKPLFS
jgi:BirA family transcriptional regulator, biotin operon repressor / biotin---[acetyl-CoA-carboxylase] ligase